MSASNGAGEHKVLAYLATSLPSRSETFVYREIRELRQRQWRVLVTSLYPPDASLGAGFDDLTRGSSIVYGRRLVAAASAEALGHPLRSLATVAQACRDALTPGEALSARQRAKLLVQAAAGLGLARELRRHEVAHIHCHFAHAPTSVGMYASMQLGIPFSFTGHANDLFQRRSLLRRKLERADFVACISRFHRELYDGIVTEARSRYRVIRCGVDMQEWSPVVLAPAEGRPLRVLSVARLVPKKGIDVLLRAIADLTRDVELRVAGDGPERERLVALADELGCTERVTWLGPIDNDAVRAEMRAADVFVLPCKSDGAGDRDGIPVVLMEAMACGLPAVSGDLPAIRELIEDGVSGGLVPGGDDAALGALLATLSDATRRAWGTAGRNKVEREFSLELNVSRLEAALRGD
jgi:colanic acid/amylovoran biosynthesis glycosyltransferase